MERYQIIKQLGKGGMGRVFLAEDIRVRRKVAMKIIEPVNLSFGIEMEMLRDLKSDLIPIIYDAWIEGDKGIIIMEYVEGKTLQEYIQCRKELSENQIFEWGNQIGEFLKQIHTLRPKMLYRDLKPENIMVLPDGTLKIIDLGAATMMERDKLNGGKRVGTYGYASPEQWKGEEVDERTDIYSLGAVLLDMFRGTCEGTVGSDMTQISQERYVPEGMVRLIRKCLEQKPEKRYASAEGFLKDWKNYKKAEHRSFAVFYLFYVVLLGCLCYAAYVIWHGRNHWDLCGYVLILYLFMKGLQLWYENRKAHWTQLKSVWCRG